MNQEKLAKQAKILRTKKLVKSATNLTPTVEKGVVKFDYPIPKKQKPQSYKPPTPPNHLVQKPAPIKPPNVDRRTVAPSQSSKGCTGCRRKRKL